MILFKLLTADLRSPFVHPASALQYARRKWTTAPAGPLYCYESAEAALRAADDFAEAWEVEAELWEGPHIEATRGFMYSPDEFAQFWAWMRHEVEAGRDPRVYGPRIRAVESPTVLARSVRLIRRIRGKRR